MEAEELLDDAPEHPEGLFLLGEALLELADFSMARMCYEQRVGLDGGDAASLLGLAIAAFQGCDLAMAVEASREVVRLQPDNAEGHYYLGLALERIEGRATESLAELSAASHLDPDRFPLPMQLGEEDWEQLVGAAVMQLHPRLQTFYQQIQFRLEDLPELSELKRHDPPLPPTIGAMYLGHPPDAADPWVHRPDAIRLFARNLGRAPSPDDLVTQLSHALQEEALDWLGMAPRRVVGPPVVDPQIRELGSAQEATCHPTDLVIEAPDPRWGAVDAPDCARLGHIGARGGAWSVRPAAADPRGRLVDRRRQRHPAALRQGRGGPEDPVRRDLLPPTTPTTARIWSRCCSRCGWGRPPRDVDYPIWAGQGFGDFFGLLQAAWGSWIDPGRGRVVLHELSVVAADHADLGGVQLQTRPANHKAAALHLRFEADGQADRVLGRHRPQSGPGRARHRRRPVGLRVCRLPTRSPIPGPPHPHCGGRSSWTVARPARGLAHPLLPRRRSECHGTSPRWPALAYPCVRSGRPGSATSAS